MMYCSAQNIVCQIQIDKIPQWENIKDNFAVNFIMDLFQTKHDSTL